MFGKSVFQSVLERLREEEDEAADVSEDAAFVAAGVRGLGAGYALPETGLGAVDTGFVHRAYADMAGPDADLPAPIPAPAPQKPVMPAQLKRVTPQEVFEDLGFLEQETLSSLSAKRRIFASENHPDRHDAGFRANATIRMKIANMLIDEAIRRVEARSL